MEGSDLWRGAGAEGGLVAGFAAGGPGDPSGDVMGLGARPPPGSPEIASRTLFPSADLSDAVSDGVTHNHSMAEDHKSLLRASVSPSAPGDNCPFPSSPHPRNTQPG